MMLIIVLYDLTSHPAKRQKENTRLAYIDKKYLSKAKNIFNFSTLKYIN